MSKSMEIEATTVVRLIDQYLIENNLRETSATLHTESKVGLNAFSSELMRVEFVQHMETGRWDLVLPQLEHLKLSMDHMLMIFEHVLFELIEVKDIDVAAEVFARAEVFERLKDNNPMRYAELQRWIQRGYIDANVAYSGLSRIDKRKAIAKIVQSQIIVAPPSRLLTLIGQALKFQRLQGILPSEVDLLTNATKKESRRDYHEKVLTGHRMKRQRIKFGQQSIPQCLAFSPIDETFLVTGSLDGLIEVWDTESCKLRRDLEYQVNDDLMIQDSAISTCAFHFEGVMLATGSASGQVKIWNVYTGACVRTIDRAHAQAINQVVFNRPGTHVLTGSFDQLIRLYGLTSGNIMQEYRGHTSTINALLYTADGSHFLSGATDGTIRIWNEKSGECIQCLTPPNATKGLELDILHLLWRPATDSKLQRLGGDDMASFLLCTRSRVAYLMNCDGQVQQTFTIPNNRSQSGTNGSEDIVSGTFSFHGKYVYLLLESGSVCIFQVASGTFERRFQASECTGSGQVSGPQQHQLFEFIHHPHRNLALTYGRDGYIRFWT